MFGVLHGWCVEEVAVVVQRPLEREQRVVRGRRRRRLRFEDDDVIEECAEPQGAEPSDSITN